MDSIKSVEFLRPLDRWRIYPDIAIGANPDKPEYFTLGNSELLDATTQKRMTWRVHRSRVLIFPGLGDWNIRQLNGGWGDSILQAMYESYVRFFGSLSAIQTSLQDFSVFVLAIQDLHKFYEKKNGEDQLRNLIEVNDRARSVHRMMITSADKEKVMELARSYGSIPELLSFLKEELTGAVSVGGTIPQTILWGQSPAGQNATGESDRFAFAMSAHQLQRDRITKPLRYLSELIFRAKDGPSKGKIPQDWDLAPIELFQRSQKEKLEERRIQAEIDRTYKDLEVLAPEEVRESRFGGAEYSYETVLDEAAYKKLQEEQAAVEMPSDVPPEDEVEGEDPAPEEEEAAGGLEDREVDSTLLDLSDFTLDHDDVFVGEAVRLDDLTFRSDKNCKKGRPCGGSCIAKSKKCRTGVPKETKEKIKAVKAKTAKPKSGVATTAAEREEYASYREYYFEKAKGLMSQFKNPPPPYQAEVAGLNSYTSVSYSDVNNLLRGGKGYTKEQARKVRLDAKMTAAALSALPDYKGTVYRGTDLPPSQIAKYKVGQTVTEKAFLSTSRSAKVTHNFDAPRTGTQAVHYVIQSKHGKSIEKLSNVPSEREVLFGPGTSFKVLSKEVAGEITRLYLEEVD